MSGFSADWLALREPADLRARDAALVDEVAAALPPAPRIVDLACGTGSTLRALAPRLGAGQSWRLVDHDPALLTRARAECAGAGCVVETRAADLAADPAAVLDGVDLVTTSAFLDLVSADWLQRFVAALAERRLPLYAALSYDGRAELQPAHPLDGAVIAAVNRHQRTDKGFGPALGPDAAERAQAMLRDAGYAVRVAASDWILAPEAELQRALVTGWAEAAAEIGTLRRSELDQWLEARRAAIDQGRSRLRVGHVDLYALPN